MLATPALSTEIVSTNLQSFRCKSIVFKVGASTINSPLFFNFCIITSKSKRISNARYSIAYWLKVKTEYNLFLSGVVKLIIQIILQKDVI